MRLVPASPRTRRRLVRFAIVAIVAAGIAIGVLAIPNHSGRVTQRFRPGEVDVVKVEKQVPLQARDRRAINRLLDRFVVAAVARRDPSSAYALATSALRAGTSSAEWRRGSLPVQPLAVRGSRFHGWTPGYVYGNEVNFELLVHARRGEDVGAISYTVDVKRVNGQWRVDSFVPSAMFAAEGKTRQIVAQVDYGPTGALGAPAKERAPSSGWLTVPLLFLALPGIWLAALLLFFWRRHRRAERIYRAARA